MNARTCLLCGKSLSRIWVGAGQDFCSREHRNQYRLRRGMDRLQEANKVANLMRRREIPKLVECVRQAGNDTSRVAEGSGIPFSSSPRAVVLPSSNWKPEVRIPALRGFVEWHSNPLAAPKSRAFGISWRQRGRVQLKMGARRVESPGEQYLERVKQPRNLLLAARAGRLLRVSEGAGFRLPSMRSKQLRVTGRVTAIRGFDQPRTPCLSSFDFPANYQVPAVGFEVQELCAPKFEAPVYRNVIGARGPISFERKAAPGDEGAVVRPSVEAWRQWDPAMPRPIRHTGRQVSTPELVALRSKAMPGAPAPHMVLMPLLPEDRAFSYIPTITSAPMRPSGVPASNLDEQFDSGLRNWTGGVGDWHIDVAGVRPGSLALFIPTLDQSDYEMEFLTHIVDRSVTWAFRASGLNDYYRATIAVDTNGGCEFSHGAVIRGAAEAAAAARTEITLNKKNAVTIRLRAAGNEFTVWLNGEPIETWTDSRFPKGGIGFLGAPDDRARIYWVRLSAGNQGKEYAKR